MDEALTYAAAVDGDLEVLYQQAPPVRRLRGVYRTSRHNLSFANAALLWDSLAPLRLYLDAVDVPRSQDEYDHTVIACALDLERQLDAINAYGGFGIGQKIVNLFMKDQWALGAAASLERLLHAPLDRIVLRHVSNRCHLAPSWQAWTKVVAGNEDAKPVVEYRRLQDWLRSAAADEGLTLIRYEQRLWDAGRDRASAKESD